MTGVPLLHIVCKKIFFGDLGVPTRQIVTGFSAGIDPLPEKLILHVAVPVARR
jgi:hypothetical protein